MGASASWRATTWTRLPRRCDVDRVGLDRRLRENLVFEGVLPECVEAEFARIMETLTTF